MNIRSWGFGEFKKKWRKGLGMARTIDYVLVKEVREAASLEEKTKKNGLV